eukprot:4430917-Amphidinium_carterae.1
MQDKQGQEAAALWRKILRGIPPYERRFGAPTLLSGTEQAQTLADITAEVLQSTYVHYAGCLQRYQVEAARAEYQAWKLKIADRSGCNRTVSARLKGKRLGQSTSLP